MVKPTNKERLEHVIQAIDSIKDFMDDMEEEEFLQNSMIQSAVLYQFLIIGEAIKSIESWFLEPYPYPWNVPKSFRNFIAHEYHKIKMTRVYAASEDLDQLKALMNHIIEKEFPETK